MDYSPSDVGTKGVGRWPLVLGGIRLSAAHIRKRCKITALSLSPQKEPKPALLQRHALVSEHEDLLFSMNDSEFPQTCFSGEVSPNG